MAGHFVVFRLKGKADVELFEHYPGTAWSGVAHTAGTVGGGGHVFQGWTAATSQLLDGVRNGSVQPANRNLLPPHKYLTFPGGPPTAAQSSYLQGCEWIPDIVRPSAPGFGSRGLCQAAAAAWAGGDRHRAPVEQFTHGATSIEVYYVGTKRVE